MLFNSPFILQQTAPQIVSFRRTDLPCAALPCTDTIVIQFCKDNSEEK